LRPQQQGDGKPFRCGDCGQPSCLAEGGIVS
jgi:hypothetical protein